MALIVSAFCPQKRETRARKKLFIGARFLIQLSRPVYKLSRIPKLSRIRLKRFTNFPSRRIIIPRETTSARWYPIAEFFFTLRPSSVRVRRRPDWHCKCINVCSYCVRQFAFVLGNFSSSFLSPEFQSWKYFPGREVPIHIYFFIVTLSFINIREKKLLSFFFSLLL